MQAIDIERIEKENQIKIKDKKEIYGKKEKRTSQNV